MNTHYIVLILLEYLSLNELFLRLTAIPKVKFGVGVSNRSDSHTKPHFLLKDPRHYLYLNYKEAYGLRFDPKKSDKSQHTSNQLNDKLSWNRIPAEEIGNVTTDLTTDEHDSMPMVSNSLKNISTDTTTIVSPSSGNSFTIIDDKVALTQRTQSNKRQVLASSTLRYRIDASAAENLTTSTTTTMTTTAESPTTIPSSPSSASLPTTTTTTSQESQKPSTLRDTLNLIRLKLKQWLSFGGDKKPPLISGQRFLSVFNVINFENSPCTSTQEDLTDMSGICYHDYQCEQMGGTPIDECADGLGVCCVCKKIY